ncbi:MAG: UPF0175 family protein [Rhodothermales bacterium]
MRLFGFSVRRRARGYRGWIWSRLWRFGATPEEFAKELRLAAAIKWYEVERLSQSKAAEVAGLSRAAFVDALGWYGVSAIQTKPEELGEDVRQALGESTDDA